jgi:hypothetical protein
MCEKWFKEVSFPMVAFIIMLFSIVVAFWHSKNSFSGDLSTKIFSEVFTTPDAVTHIAIFDGVFPIPNYYALDLDDLGSTISFKGIGGRIIVGRYTDPMMDPMKSYILKTKIREFSSCNLNVIEFGEGNTSSFMIHDAKQFISFHVLNAEMWKVCLDLYCLGLTGKGDRVGKKGATP